MLYTFDHTIQFKDGTATAAYRNTEWWRTIKGCLRAAERYAYSTEKHYEDGSICTHSLRVWNDKGEFVTNMAA